MRRLLLPLSAIVLLSAAGCSQIIADKVLVPPRSLERAATLLKLRQKIEARWDQNLRPFNYTATDGAQLAAMIFDPRPPKENPGKSATTQPTSQSAPPAKIPADKAPPAAAPFHPRGVVVVIHGLTDRKESMLSAAEKFADAGYVAVVPDLRAHGESGGRYTTLGYREKLDMMALLNHLQSQGYDVSRVAAMGGSLGAAVAIQWAAVDPRVKAIVAVAPFADLRTELEFQYRAHGIGGFKVDLLESVAEAQGQFKIENVSPLKSLEAMDTPLYLAHGFRDKIIPDSESQRLFDHARGPVILQKAVCGHMDIRDNLGKEFVKRAVEWVDTYVPADAHPATPPAWVTNYGSRNLPMTAPVAVGGITPASRIAP